MNCKLGWNEIAKNLTERRFRSWGVRSLTRPPDRRTIGPITAQVRSVISSSCVPRPRASCPFVRGLLFGCGKRNGEEDEEPATVDQGRRPGAEDHGAREDEDERDRP